MTVQAYKERISELQQTCHEFEDKLQSMSRALKLSSSMFQQRDNETSHRFDSLEARLNAFERKQSQIETDTKMFVNSDMPIIYNEVQNIVKKQLLEITEKYANVEKRCNEMVTQRRDGYSDVYSALEKKLEHLVAEQLDKYQVKLLSNHEELKQWVNRSMMEQIHAVHENMKRSEQRLEFKINEMQTQIVNEQPKYIKNAIKENVKHLVKDCKYKSHLKLNLQHKLAERAKEACSKIADDVHKKLQNQRYDLIKQIRSVETRITEQLRQTVLNLAAQNAEQQKIQQIANRNEMKRKCIQRRSKSMTLPPRNNPNVQKQHGDEEDEEEAEEEDEAEQDVQAVQQMNLNKLRKEIMDYRSEMLHSQQKLSELENKFSEKLQCLQAQAKRVSSYHEPETNTSSSCGALGGGHDNGKLVELDRKYSEIQNSINGLQAMISGCNSEFAESRDNGKKAKVNIKNSRKNAKKKTFAQKRPTVRRKVIAKADVIEAENCNSPMAHSPKLPSHLTPHLSDLDNLVQCVLEVDQIEKRHSNTTLKASKTPHKTRKQSVRSTPSKKKPLWK